MNVATHFHKSCMHRMYTDRYVDRDITQACHMQGRKQPGGTSKGTGARQVRERRTSEHCRDGNSGLRFRVGFRFFFEPSCLFGCAAAWKTTMVAEGVGHQPVT